MNIRISPAAAAVLVAFGLFTSGLRAASGPAGVPFENDASFTAVLSNTNPNKIIIDGELITRISGPSGAYDSNTTATDDGALIFSPLTAQNFTVFIETAKGAALSLNVQPKPVAGRTLRFTPLTPPTRKNDDAKAWEEGQSYEKTLVAISRAVSRGDVPDDFVDYPVTRMAAYSPNVAVQLSAERQLVGSHLRVVRYRLKNPGYVTMNLRERDFWKKGVRSVMLSTRQLYAGGEGFVWVIFSDEGVNN
jgi:conjugal transfer pilus assembly protein TraK